MMTQGTIGGEVAIRAAAEKLVRRYGWQLVDAAALAAAVATRRDGTLDADAGEDQIFRQAAAALLFAACVRAGLPDASAAERARGEHAYHDLGRYLAAIAPLLAHPAQVTPADLVQEALLTIHQTHRTCRRPAAFLAWAAVVLRRKAAEAWRDAPAEVVLCGEEAEGRPETVSAAPASADRHVDPLGDQEVLRVLHAALDTDEERVYALCVLFGLKRRELGLLFDAPLAHFDQVGQRVKRKLRANPAFCALFAPRPGGGQH